MRTITVLLSLASLFTVNAAILHVGQGVMAPYSSIQTAINAASPGDTITIAPSPYAYSGNITVDRMLTIIGAGYDTTAGSHTLVEGMMQITASGCNVRSLWLRGSRCSDSNYEFSATVLQIEADSALVEDCCVENSSSGGFNCYCVSGLLVASDVTVAKINRCVFWLPNAPYGCGCGVYVEDSSAVRIESCIFSYGPYGIHAENGAQMSVGHCVFHVRSTLGGFGVRGDGYFTITNSACIGTPIASSSSHNPQFSFCASSVEAPQGQGNILLNSGEFVNVIANDPVGSDYRLAPSSPLIDAGDPTSYNDRDGSRADIGIYGGQNPYRPFGIPAYPFILSLEVQPLNVPQDGILEIRSTGRVGEGGGE